MDWHPLRFHPLLQPRVWGGHRLAELYGKPAPQPGPIGESWEIADRPEATSIVAEGPLAGRSLRDLMNADPAGLLGDAEDRAGRFPLLVKILDARQVLSLQVHPPPHLASALGGEPKSELWYFTETRPEAEILAGLRPGVTRADFERRLAEGTVAECFHRLPVRPGDALFLPSGRVHALGAGVVLFEIQENSDTTYRVFDWNRVGLDGKPRALHLRESLACIDFTDVEPALLDTPWETIHPSDQATRVLVSAAAEVAHHGRLVPGPPFSLAAHRAGPGGRWRLELPRCAVLAVVSGCLEIPDSTPPIRLHPGDVCLLPAALGTVECRAPVAAEWLRAEPRRHAAGPTPHA